MFQTLFIGSLLLFGLAQANPLASVEDVAPPMVRTWWIITPPHEKIIKEYQPKIDLLKRQVSADSESAKVIITNAKSEIVDIATDAVKDANLAIQQSQTSINLELKKTSVIKDKDLKQCWELQRVRVNSLRASDINLCVPTQDFADWNDDLKGITALSSNAANVGKHCASMYPSASQEDLVKNCIENEITTIEAASTTQLQKIRLAISTAKETADTCIQSEQSNINAVLLNAKCP